VDIQCPGLKGAKPVGDPREFRADGIRMFQSLLEPEVLGEVVAANLVAQEGQELLVLFEKRIPQLGSQAARERLLKRPGPPTDPEGRAWST